MNLNAVSLLAIILLLLQAAACSQNCYFPDAMDQIAPDWICDANESTDITAVGFAEHSAAGFSFMKQMAAANARQQLANKLNRQSLKPLSNTELINTQMLQSTTSPNGNLYVLIGFKDAR